MKRMLNENMVKKRNSIHKTLINTFIMFRMSTHPSCSKIAKKITVRLTLCHRTKLPGRAIKVKEQEQGLPKTLIRTTGLES